MKQFTQGGVGTVVSRGFALPTVLIASVVMIIVLLAGVQTVVVSRLSIEEQYYHRLASEAAESGLEFAAACIKADASYDVTWPSGSELETGEDCTGTVDPSASTTVVSQNIPVHIETKYSVDYPNASQNPITIEASGVAQLLRRSDNSVWKEFSVTKKMSLSRGVKVVSQFSSGTGFSCAIFDGESWCFGRNTYGNLGVGKCHDDPDAGGEDFNRGTLVSACDKGSMHVSLVPLKVSREEGVLQGKVDKYIAAGDYGACVASTDPSVSTDSVYCWGDNANGQLGLGDTLTKMAPYPRKITAAALQGKTVTDLQAGKYRMCAAASGDVYCWGYGTAGALGNNSTAHNGVPQKVQGIGNSDGRPVQKIATAPDMDSTCAIISSGGSAGQVYCWGRNHRGQLGIGLLGPTSNTYSATAIRAGTSLSPNPLTNVVSLVSGGGVSNQGTINDMSNGNPSTSLGVDSTTATYTGRITKEQYCAITSAKKLYCWGANQFGQLGIGLTTLSADAQVAPRNSRSLAPVQPDRPLVYDTYPSNYTYLAPFNTVPTTTQYNVNMNDASVTVESVAISYGSTCVLLSAPASVAGKVFCVGENAFGIGRSGRKSAVGNVYNNDLNQIAKNYFYQMITKNIPSTDSISSVTGNTNRMCVVANNRLYCLGNNAVGQLGTGDTVNHVIPTEAKVLRQFDSFQIY